MANIKKIIKLFVPPIIYKVFLLFKSRKVIEFKEIHVSWDDALKETANGYSSENILLKCRDSLLKVKNGEYPYERDSVLFTEMELFFPLLSSLFYVSSQNNNVLNLIDFGGSLGSTYFQNRDLLKQAKIKINWNIIEQDNFVTCGKENFANDELHFFNSIDEIGGEVNCLLFSSVLPYLRDPYTILDSIMQYSNIEYIIIDRTLFIENEAKDVLSIQKVSSEIYEASYPAWFLSLDKFYNYINTRYIVIFQWHSIDNIELSSHKTKSIGFFLKKIN